MGIAVQRSPNDGQGVGSNGGGVTSGVAVGAGVAGPTLGLLVGGVGVDVLTGDGDGSIAGAQLATIGTAPKRTTSAMAAIPRA